MTWLGSLSLPVIVVREPRVEAGRLRPFGVNCSTTTLRLLSAVAPLRSVTTTRSDWRPTSDPRGRTLQVYGALVSVQILRVPR